MSDFFLVFSQDINAFELFRKNYIFCLVHLLSLKQIDEIFVTVKTLRFNKLVLINKTPQFNGVTELVLLLLTHLLCLHIYICLFKQMHKCHIIINCLITKNQMLICIMYEIIVD